MSTGAKVALGMLALALLSALGAFFGYRLGCDPALHEAACQGDSMTWIRREYHLTPEQFSAITQLHERYSETCDEHCRKIREAVKQRERLRSQAPLDKEGLAAADTEIGRLSSQCEAALKEHLRQVAALMNREDGASYLATMTPLLERFDHSGTPDLRLSAPAAPHQHEHRK